MVFSTTKRLALKFDNELLERRYRENTLANLRPRVLFAMASAALLWLAFGILDSFNTPDMLAKMWSIRVAVWTGYALVSYLTFTKFFLRFPEVVIVSGVVLTVLGIYAVLAIVPPHVEQSYYTALILMIPWMYLVAGISLTSAVIINIVLIAGYNVLNYLVHQSPPIEYVNRNFFLFGASFLAIVGAYMLESKRRFAFSLNNAIESISSSWPVFNVNEVNKLHSDVESLIEEYAELSKNNQLLAEQSVEKSNLIASSLDEQERLRKTIADRLHDNVEQYLLAARQHAFNIHKALISDQDVDVAATSEDAIKLSSMLSDAQRALHGIRAPLETEILDNLGLLQAIRDIFSTYRESPLGGPVEIDAPVSISRRDRSIEVQLLRAIEEIVSFLEKSVPNASIHVLVQENGSSLVLEIAFTPSDLSDWSSQHLSPLSRTRERIGGIGGHYDFDESGKVFSIHLPNTRL